MDGVIVVNKPSSMTSRDVVNHLCKVFKTKKIGHAGTLDPLASGVLVVCIGRYTKLVSLLTGCDKEYVGEMRLGYCSSTLDVTGDVSVGRSFNGSDVDIKNVFKSFPRHYFQEVPMYSAVKVKGRRLYDYALHGDFVSLPKREVFIKSLEIILIQNNLIKFKAFVSKGTYIRSLIVDIANLLGCDAVMESLVRIRQGVFDISSSYDLALIDGNTPLLGLADIFDYPRVVIGDDVYFKVINGNQLSLSCSFARVFLEYNGVVVALYELVLGVYRPLFNLVCRQ